MLVHALEAAQAATSMAMLQGTRGAGGRLFSDREQPQTPPRDDPATRPRFKMSPRELDDMGLGPMGNHTREATRQACTLVIMVFVAVVVAISAAVGLYGVATAVMGKQVFIACKDQPIENGIVKAAVVNGSGLIQCDHGYMLEQTPNVQLACRLVHKKCRVYQRATATEAAMKKCTTHYVFVPAAENGDLMIAEDASQTEVEDHVARLELSSYEMTRGACVLSAQVRSEQLYRQRRGPVHGVPRSTATWSSEASVGALVLLSGLAILSLVASAVGKAREGDGGVPRYITNEPDTAALLDDVESAALLDDVESS